MKTVFINGVEFELHDDEYAALLKYMRAMKRRQKRSQKKGLAA